MSIKGTVLELENLQAEIKRNNLRNRELRKRSKVLHDEITDYLKNQGQDGMKYNGRAIVVERKERRPARKKDEKRYEAISVLEAAGVDDPDKIYDQILDAHKGDPVEQYKLKFTKLKGF